MSTAPAAPAMSMVQPVAQSTTRAASKSASSSSSGKGSFPLPPAVDGDRNDSLVTKPMPIPAYMKAEYDRAGKRFGLPPALLAGIGMEETHHDRLKSDSVKGAQGPMQWLPKYWPAYAQDGDGDGDKDIKDPADSVATAAWRLVEGGAKESPEGVNRAIFAYNHSKAYVADVLYYAHAYGGGQITTDPVAGGPGGGQDCEPAPVSGGSMDCPPVTKFRAIEKGLKPNPVRALRCIAKHYPKVHRYSGVGPRPTNPDSDHPKGLAIDVWTNGPALGSDHRSPAAQAYGWQIARWVQANAKALGVKYALFYDKEWHASQGNNTWRPYRHPSGDLDDSSRHRDHVHISFLPGDTGGGGSTPPGGGGGGPVAPSGGFANPLGGKGYRISSPFGYRIHPITGEWKLHAGVDLAIGTGTPIASGCTGRVKATKPFAGTGGNETWVDCGGGITMVYLHQHEFRTKTGASVKAGQTIGTVGNTGRSGGPHLHFEVHVNGTPVEPVKWMRQKSISI